MIVISGLLLIALVGEAYFRLTKPFMESSVPSRFVDGVGLIRKPNTEVRYASHYDNNFVVSRANSQGFLDREPISSEYAAAGCHIAFIGDSFVEAMEVPIADKFHVRLEEMAARELPRLDIATQAYGIRDTGQINQIPFYEEYARHLNPKLVALVFTHNDFSDNSTALQALKHSSHPDRLAHMSAQRDDSGALKLVPPDPEYAQFLLPKNPARWYAGGWIRLKRISYFASWLEYKNLMPLVYESRTLNAKWVNMIAQRPCCAWVLDNLHPPDMWYRIYSRFLEEYLPPVYRDELEYTVFGIEQFKRLSDLDGATLAIVVATDRMGTRGDPQFDRLNDIAELRGIPVISQYHYIASQGHDYKNARWRFDPHWNDTGHQWTAEAVLEWLKENQEVCD